MNTRESIFVAITGAQGVGKSTFCAQLVERLKALGHSPTLIAGLGDQLLKQGFVLGMLADERSVAAVVLQHLKREREAPGGIVILDRCLIDMLAYKRALNVTPDPLSEVYEEVAKALVPRLRLVIFLEMSDAFQSSSASHEDTDFRRRVDSELQRVIKELSVRTVHLDASSTDAPDAAATAVTELVGKLAFSDK